MEKTVQLYEGKAKKVYATDNEDIVLVSYKDDATAFNGIKKGQIYGKGVVNNLMSNHMFRLLEKEGVPIKEGLIPLLKYLKDNNYKTIVATSSNIDRVDNILASANIVQYFDDSICGDEVTKGKPDPEVFLKSCQKLGVNVDEAIVLEDSEAGIQASAAAQIKVICIPDMKQPEKEFADKTFKILDNLNQVKDYLKTL